ncbi:hypothetical protein ABIB86_000424 [Bradyrhizobium sp. JR1.7]|uniref:LPD38 domain-containing protein n=1 Tax=unclassified Bradyrhizobium TaxID=2631580 RepID=UPI003393FE63
MAFDDVFGSGQSQLRDSLLEQYQPDDGQPYSSNPKVLTDRLARKLSIKPTRDSNVDFNVAPDEPKGPDLSSFGTKVKDEAAPEPSTDDLSKFGTPVTPEGPEVPPLTISRQAVAAAKGIPHGAISTAGGTLKGAAALYDNGIPEQPETPQYDAMGNATGMVNAPAAAVPAKPLQDRTLYKAGQATQDFAQTVAPMTPQEKDSIGGRIGTGAGSIAAYGAATLAAGPLVGLTAAASGMALDTYGSVFEASKAAGKTDDEANATAAKSALVAGVLGSLPLGAGKYAQGLIAKVAVSAAAFTTLGEAQEAILQEIAKDYDPKAGYTLDQKRIIAELILGAGMGGLHHAFERRGPETRQDTSSDTSGASPAPGGALPGGGPDMGGPGPDAARARAEQEARDWQRRGWDDQAGAAGAGPNPGGGPQPGPGGAGNQQSNQRSGQGPEPGKPPPGTGEGMGADYTMDARMRAKMEKLHRMFDPSVDVSKMSDADLFNAVNEQMRDTSSTGYTAKPETADEKAAREAVATDRAERDALIAKGWDPSWVKAMTPEQRSKAYQAAMKTGRSRPSPGEKNDVPNQARDEQAAGIQDLEEHQGEVQQPDGSRVQELRSEGDQDGSGVGKRLPDVLDGGGSTSEPRSVAGSDRERQGLRSGEHAVGDKSPAGGEPQERRDGNSEWGDGKRIASGNQNGAVEGGDQAAVASRNDVSEQASLSDEKSAAADATRAGREVSPELGAGTRDKPIRVESVEHIDAAMKARPDEPKSQAQAEAENYRHTHLEIPALGLVGKHSISVETGAGQVRKGVDPDGNPWEVTLKYPYGRIKGTVGGDGQPLDVHLGPGGDIFVIDQHDPKTGAWDEHKIMIGFPGPDAAMRAYADSYSDHGESRIGHVVAMTPEKFQAWLQTDTTKPVKEIGAAGPESHHTPEPALTKSESHHTPDKALQGGQDALGGNPSLPKDAALAGTKQATPAVVNNIGSEPAAPQQGRGRDKTAKTGAKEPQNLLQFIASKGGLKPHPELAVMDAHKHSVAMQGFPPRRKLVKDGGMDLDRAREAAEEAGYFRGSAEGTSTVAEFLDAIDDGIRGQHRYPEGHEDTKTKAEQSAEAERGAHEEAKIQEFVDALERTGHGHLAPEIKARALQLMSSTELDAPEAVETAVMQLISEEKDAQAEFHAIYGHEVDDEIYAQAASGYGDNLAREGAEGHGPEEAAPREPRPGDAVAGAEGGDRRNDAGRTEPDAKGEQPDTGSNAARTGREGRAEDSAEAERSLRDLDGTSADIPAGDSDETVHVTLSRKGPWDFNDTWPAPDPKVLDALAREGRSVFDIEDGEHFDVENVVGVVDEGMNGIMSALSQVRAIDEKIADIRSGKAKLKKKQKPEDAIKALQGERSTYGREAVDTAASYEEVFGREAARAMMIEARRRLRGEEAQSPVRATPPKPESKETVDSFLDHVESEIAAGRMDTDIAPTTSAELFGSTAESRGWTQAKYGKGSALWSPDRKHVMFVTAPVAGNHLNVQWGTPGENITPPGGEPKKPAVITETGADNKQQTVIPGAEKAADKTMAQRGADAPLKPKANQKAADDGLFGDGHKQTDLLDMVAKKPPAPPKDAFDDIFDQAIDAEFAPKMSLDIDQVAKGLGKLFGKDKGLAEGEQPFTLDDDKYRQALPFFKAGVAHFSGGGADLATMVRALVRHLSVAGMDADAIRAMKPYIRRFTEDVTSGKETIDAPSRSDVLESDRGEPEARDGLGKADVPAAAGSTGQGAGERGSPADAGDERPASGERVPQDHAPVVGASGHLELPAREPVDEGSDPADRESSRSSHDSEKGFSFDDGATDEAVRNAQKDADLNARRERQRKAEGIAVKPGDLGNIADTLPMLFPEQHTDVQKAEQRYAKPDGHGMLFTNGTGTGKTYSGLGVIKRFAMKGKTNTLVVAPSQGILMDWVKSAKDLGLDMRVLDDTASNGRKGLVGTTYANLGANRTLADREWDLVVPDEAHKLSSDQNGTVTEALRTLRAITKHPDGLTERARMVLRADYDRIEHLPKNEQGAAYAAFEKKAAPLIEKWRDEQRPKALFMSATPFAYHFSLDYAEGYLFEFDKDRSGSRYNSGDGRAAFYMQHLGYRMRTNRLTKPDADVKSEVMERQLHEYLKKQGSLSGRALTVDKDYDRKFVLAHDAVGQQIDQALSFLQEAEGGRYRPLHEVISKQFDYLTRMRLLEAIKARAAVPFIRQSLDLGRKIVVFHDYNEGGGINPFDLAVPPSVKVTTYVDGKPSEVKLKDLYDDFRAQNPYIKDLKFSDYDAPIAELTKAFPDAMVYNGTVSNKVRNLDKALFNDDNSGRDIIIVQSAAGEAGISLHDTTGKKQRVLLNLGMPIRPTTSIQQEGRIYRVGQSSDAIFRYMNTGTDWERWTFAGKIAERAGTAENLALGDQARTIRQSFIDAFSGAGDFAPEPGEGKGGKEIDRALSHSVSEFDKAKTHYFANGKTTGRRDQREGTDYYATPEPIGLKMVEFAGIKSGEKILEPSAGHGAIARYFPEDTARTLVEPSSSLASRAALTSPGARVVVDRFENLDKGANKFDAIVMNPPFGSGGKTAIDHLEKAASHLKNGGRIVALISRGSTDAKFDKFMDGPAAKGIYIVGDVNLPAITFERAGTSISARIVVLEKQTDAHIAKQLQQKSRDYSDVETIGDLFDRIENADMGQRLEPATPDIDIPTEGKVTINGVDFTLQSSKRGDVHAADLKNFIGPERFRALMRAVETTKGEYVKTAKSFRFGTTEERQKFLDAVAKPEPAETQRAPGAPPSAPKGITFKTGETIHAKTKAKLYVATANERVESTAYSQMNAVAKANGGYYSSFKGNGAIPGFQFKSAEDRQKFLDQMAGKGPGGDGPGPGLASAETDAVMDRLVRAYVAPAPEARRLGETGQKHVLQHGRETSTEHLMAYDAHGNVVDNGDIKGTKGFIAISPAFYARLLDPTEDIVAHHNHPESRSFSDSDIAMASTPGMRAVYAHGHNGITYRVEVTPTAKAMLPEQWTARVNQVARLTAAIGGRLKMPLREAFLAGSINADEGNAAYHHLINVVLNDAGFIDYRTNFDDADFRSRVPGIDTAISEAADLIKKGLTNHEASRVHDRPARAVRHPGDVGAVFDRNAFPATDGGTRRGDQAGRADHPREEEGGLGLNAPPNAFQPGGPNSFDNTIADILRTRLLGRLGHINATEIRVQLQDKFLRVKKAEESVGAPSSQSAYQAESLYYGRTGQRLESLTENHIDPLIREMKARDIDVEKLDNFLKARHAPERNNAIGTMYTPGHDFYDAIRDHDKVGGSGWSTNEALQVIRDLRNAGKLPDYLAVARMIDALNAKTRRTLFDAGLIDRDTFDAWNNGYKYYVPLRGWADGSEDEASMSRQGSGMNVRGKEAKNAFGRKSDAASPLAYSIMQAEMAIVRAEKNRVGNTFLQFVRANPDPARWTINRRQPIKRIDPNTGLVTTIPDNMPALKDNEFSTKVDGRTITIALHGPDGLNLARGLKNMGTANVHALIRAYSAITHTMAKLATSFNPEFMIPNFARDMGEAFINLQAQQQRGFVRNFIKHIPGAMKGSMKAIAGAAPGDPYVDAFHRFDKAGGRVRFFGIEDPDAIETNVGRKLKRLEGGPVNTLKDIGDKAGKALEVAGGGIENATRLAAFMAAEEAGIPTADAAMLARNLTVDFNKKGELGSAISALYMFANAGVQGIARMTTALGHRRVWQAVGALAAAAALSTLYSILASDTDEAGVSDYMKIPSWDRDKNLVFMMGGHRYLKVPLPYGFSPFAVIGSHAVSVAMGKEKPGKAASAIMDSILSAFNPLGEESSTWMDIIPSALRPAFHIEFNRDWTGKPLYPEQDKNRGVRPDSSQAFKSNSAFSKEAAKDLNAWSGGSSYQPGAIDVHPASIDHVLQAVTGGVGRFAKGIADTLYNTATGGEWQPEKTPILRRFVGKVGPEADRALYYEQRQEALDDKAGINSARKDLKGGTNTDEARQFLSEAPTTKASIFKSADERIKGLRQNKSLSETELRDKIREVQNHARAEVQRLQPSH